MAMSNYENLANAWAIRLDKPFDIDPEGMFRCLQLVEALFSGVYPETIETIEIDPHSFAERVSTYRHAMANQHQEEL